MADDSHPRSRPLLRRFWRHEAGNVAVMFGLLLLPMIGGMGLAIDYGSVLTARNKGQVAADAAALQAAGVARDLIKSGDGSDAATAAAIAEAKRRAELLFKAHADQSGLKGYSATITVARSGLNITSTAAFTVNTTTYLAKLFGQKTYGATGAANSKSSLPGYSDVYLALDISGSMGIASSQADMVTLFNAKGRRTTGAAQQTGCVFGCHVVESGWAESFSTTAARYGVKLRIDVLRDAVQQLISTAESDADSAPIYRVALYTMGASADASTWSLNPAATLTDNFTKLKAAAATIDIATPPASNPQKQNSYINEQLNSMNTIVTQSYDGTSQQKSKKYVFIITDGARDVPSSFGSCTTPSGSGRCTNGIDPAYCKTMKNKGITVGVLYTTYVPVAQDPANPKGPLDYWFNLEMVGTGTYAKLQPTLSDCASPGWFFEATDGDAITAAMKKMFAQTTLAPSLTN